ILVRPLAPFFFSLTHMCRNIVDHGVEAPVTRKARGKDPAGQITINAAVLKGENFDRLKIDISDDGNGIDPMINNVAAHVGE
ncbi:MAG: hypothetical protein EBZ69_09875, partial [Alphaproteobacteria bacterium]|nr:hypothetical protein [Alphaproteobacteria bacterium]